MITYALIFSIGAVCLLPFFLKMGGVVDVFEPIYWAAGYFALLFVLRPLYDLILGSEFLGEQPFDLATEESFNLGLLYAFLSFCFFLLGYYSRIGVNASRYVPSLPERWSPYKVKVGIIFLLGLGIFSYILLIESFGGWNYYSSNKSETLTAGGQGYLLFGVSLVLVAFSLNLTNALHSRRRNNLLLVFLLIILLVMGFFSGSKSSFLMPVVVLLVSFHYLRRAIRVRQIVGFALVVFMLFPVFNIYRQYSDGINLEAVGDEQIAEGHLFELLVRHGMSRFYGIDSLAIIIRDTPSVMDYQYGDTISPLFVAWIPRQLWEGKPTISFGKEFAERYMPEFFEGTGTSASPTLLGEAYLNWHLPGALFAAFVSGIVISFIYSWLVVKSYGAPAIFIYSQIFIYCFSFWEASIAGLIVERVISLLMFLVIISLVGQRYQSTGNNKGVLS